MDVTELLSRHRGEIVDAATAALERSQSGHYASAGPVAVRTRLDLLFDRLLEASAGHDLTPAVNHAEAIAEERFGAGYDLAEIQAAFNALEVASWSSIFSELRPEQYGEALGVVSTILGAAKDALARRYVSLAAHGHAPSLDLRALFAGTERLTA